MTTFGTTIIGLLFLAGCVLRQPVPMQTKFDYSEHKPYAEVGENNIKGQGFLRQQGGGVVTCAGSEVMMFPATSFFREAVQHLPDGKMPQLKETLDPSFQAIIKKGQCDAQGNFSFAKLPNGAWFVFTEVNWIVANRSQGGTLLQEVGLSNGETLQILLTEKNFIGR